MSATPFRAWTLLALLALLAACELASQLRQQVSTRTGMRGGLDPAGSPVPFRWLDDGTLLVAPKTGEQSLADLGNSLGRGFQNSERVQLAIWDDEAAWSRYSQGGAEDEAVLAHKLAEYVKDSTAPDPVDRFLVFDRSGTVAYQRDFRAWPLTEMD